MTTQNLALFKGLTAKMDYLNHRQTVIAQNIANADTPGYRPSDLSKPDFSKVLSAVDKKSSSMGKLSLATTEAGHAAVSGSQGVSVDEQRATYEVAPAGNAVVMEEQMINAQKTVMDYNLMTNLYQKNMSMIMTSLGR